MKPISNNTALQAIAEGHEPVLIIALELSSGTKWFADKNLTLGSITAAGCTITVSSINSRKKSNDVGMCSAVSIVLKDDDGSIKAMLDANALEYQPAAVYQHFEGLAQADLSQLFRGSIAGPISWSEGQRTLKFQIETRTRDQQYGFAVDYIPPTDPDNIYVSPNPSVPFINQDTVGQAWPLCFGSVDDVPALLLKTAPSASLKYPFRGPRDISQPYTPDPYQDDRHLYLQDGDGANFPQGVSIDLEIDGYIFRGVLGTVTIGGTNTAAGDTFTLTEANLPKYEHVRFGARDLTDIDNGLANVAWLAVDIPIVNNWCFFQDSEGGHQYFRCIRQEGLKVEFDKAISIPSSGAFRYLQSGDKLLQVAKHGRIGWDISFGMSSSTGLLGGGNTIWLLQETEMLSRVSWRINAGASVRMWGPFRADVWVANLIPSNSIVRVAADKTNKEGVKQLVPIPASYYHVTQLPFDVTNLDGVHTVQPTLITFNPPLREYQGQGWGEQVYVTLISSVGPNTVDEIEWFFDNYSIIPVDPTSFAIARAAVQNYPSHFARFDRGDVVQLCEQICYQARLGMIIDDGVVSLVYLSKTRAAVQTYNEDNTQVNSFELTFTTTNEIYTRLEASFKTSYYPAKRYSRTLIHEENVAKYGLRKRTVDWFIYNIPSLVLKSLTFWGHREANSWRQVSIKAPMEAIALEIFDSVTLAFVDSSLLQISSIVAEVEGYSFDPTPTVELTDVDFWLPSIAGTVTIDAGAYLDDSLDVFPADPTRKFLPSPLDLRLADEESKFRVITKMETDATQIPSTVTRVQPNLDEAGHPDPVNPVIVTVSQFGNGRDKPPTAVNVQTVPIDPTKPPSVDDKVTSFTLGQQNYSVGPGGGTTLLAKLTSGVTFVDGFQNYTIDIYGNGYAVAPTKTAQTGIVVDSDSLTMGIGKRVGVFLQNNVYYILTSLYTLP